MSIKTKRLVFCALVIALYIAVMALTQSFSFGAYQIRLGTALYALAYLFPYLVLPLGMANGLSNLLFGGLGIVDVIGGFLIGLMTAGLVALLKKKRGQSYWIVPVITFVPGLGVPLYLSRLLRLPYVLLAFNLCIGQFVCGLCGFALVKSLESRVFHE